jgi:hypothetical protein
MIVSYADPGGRRVLLADTNPAIGALRVSTLTSLPEMNEMSRMNAAPPPIADSEVSGVGPEPVEAADSLLRPNLGPPPPRPDWRRGRQS